jgi:predicted homoserine dehydrogenase-like protein
LLLPARRAAGGAPLPCHLVVGGRLVRRVAAGSVLTCDDVAIAPASRVLAEQDPLFASP